MQGFFIYNDSKLRLNVVDISKQHIFVGTNNLKDMNKLIKKKRLEKRGFTQVGEITFVYESFEVVLNKTDKENPLISLKCNRTCFEFPGAWTIKDLDDLLFMHYGEDEYNSRFPHQKAKIVETVFTKEAVMEAFDEGFQSADPDMIGNDYQITSAKWFKKKYGDK